MKAAIKARELGSLVRVNSAGCLDQCELGPTIVIYPQGTWYGNVQQTDIPRIVDSIANGYLVEDLLIPDELLNTKGQGPAGPRQSGSQS